MTTPTVTRLSGSSCCLAGYLADHIAAARSVCALVDRLSSVSSEPRLKAFLTSLGKDVRQDCETLQRLGTVFETTGVSVPERTSIDDTAALSIDDTLSTFRSLEYLAMRVLEKRSLWDALVLAADHEPRLAYVDYPRLQARAIAQHYAIERRRLEIARAALIPC